MIRIILKFFGIKRVYYSIPRLNITESYISYPISEGDTHDDYRYAVYKHIISKRGVHLSWNEIEIIY